MCSLPGVHRLRLSSVRWGKWWQQVIGYCVISLPPLQPSSAQSALIPNPPLLSILLISLIFLSPPFPSPLLPVFPAPLLLYPLIPLPFLLFSSFSTFRMPYPGILLKYLFPHTISHIPVFTNAWEYAHASIMLRVDEAKRFLYPYNSLTEQQPPYTIQLKERRLLSDQKVISIAYLKHIWRVLAGGFHLINLL